MSLNEGIAVLGALGTMAALLAGATKLGRVMQRQDTAEAAQKESNSAVLTALDDMRGSLREVNTKIDARTAAESVAAIELATWRGRTDQRLDRLDQESKTVRDRTHTIANDVQTALGRTEALTNRLDDHITQATRTA